MIQKEQRMKVLVPKRPSPAYLTLGNGNMSVCA